MSTLTVFLGRNKIMCISVLPSKYINWNLQRGEGYRTTLSFRTSAHTGVGISIDFRAAYRHTGRSILPFPGICPRKVVLLSGGLPRQCAHWLAMTRNLIARQILIFHFAAASLYAKKLKYEALPGFPGRALLCLCHFSIISPPRP